MKKKEILKGSFIVGFVNAIVNSSTYWFAMGKIYPTIFLTQNSISSEIPTVFSKVVPVAVVLCFFVT